MFLMTKGGGGLKPARLPLNTAMDKRQTWARAGGGGGKRGTYPTFKRENIYTIKPLKITKNIQRQNLVNSYHW